MPRCFFDSHDSETPSEDPPGSNAIGGRGPEHLSGLGCTKSGLRATEPVFQHPCAGQRVTF